MPRSSAKRIDQIYELVNIFDKVSRQHGLNYFSESGTLLGALRHKGIIPWDDDADIGVMEQNLNKIYAMRNDLKAQGVELIDYHPCEKNVSVAVYS
jgi:lipopolysaccharide cholinephosphotransferase